MKFFSVYFDNLFLLETTHLSIPGQCKWSVHTDRQTVLEGNKIHILERDPVLFIIALVPAIICFRKKNHRNKSKKMFSQRKGCF